MNEQLFTGKAEYYEKSRPVVAEEVVDYIYSLVSPNAVFADIGAGTGKFTTLIAERGNIIYAVEPNEEMHLILTNKLKKYSNAKIFKTSAEDTKIPAKSVDIVVIVTALHWFDLNAFRAECLRILKPGGLVVAIYNSQKNEIRNKARNHNKKTATEIFFDAKCEIVEFPNPQYYSRDKFIAYHLSHTKTPMPEDENFDAYIDEINSLFDQNSVNDNFLFEFISILYIDSNFTLNY